jgi:hypothetical protein
MSLFEDPISLDRTVEQLSLACKNYDARLMQGDIVYSGPFTHTPQLTTRDAFREIREAPLPESLKRAWLKWAFYLTDARVNASHRAAIVELYRVTRHKIEGLAPDELTLRELLHRTLTQRGERGFYFNAFVENALPCATRISELWARRVEVARRGGFANLDEIETPTTDIEGLAEQFLNLTDDIYAELVPQSLEGLLDCALAIEALDGWPGKLTPRTLRSLLGSEDWLSGISLRILRLPQPYTATSFCRALARVGAAIIDARAKGQVSFVVSNDPSGLARRQFGALLGSLPQNGNYLRRSLGLSPHESERQARLLTISALIRARTSALSLLLRQKLCRSARECFGEYTALFHRTFGFATAAPIVGVFPRLHSDGAARFLGPALARELHTQLVTSFDEDWFRNPRAIESLSDDLSHPPATTIERAAAERAVSALAQSFAMRLG